MYLKKFLQSLNLILPNPAGHPCRGAARRFGYLLRMVKERYKDDSLDISGAGEKVKAAHGGRHAYAQERMAELQRGLTRWDALETVSQELGHFRPEITGTYLK